MPRVTFMTKSHDTKEAKAGNMSLDQTVEENQTKMRLSGRMAKFDNVAVAALFLTTALRKEGIVHMVHGWR